MTSTTRASACTRTSFPIHRFPFHGALARGASLLLVAGCMAAGAAAQSRSASMSGSNYVVGGDPGAIVIASLNPDVDAHPDIAVACEGSSTIVIYWGRGDGTFDPAPTTLDSLVPPRTLRSTDIGGTSLPDLVAGCESPGGIHVLLGTGQSTFAAAVSVAADPSAWVDDAAVAPQSPGSSFLSMDSLQQNLDRWVNVSGSYTREKLFDLAPAPIEGGVADLDADTLVDLLVLHQQPAQLWVLRNESGWAATSFAQTATLPAGVTPTALRVGQLDGDDRHDVVVADPGGSTVRVLRNVDTAGYQTEEIYSIPAATPWNLALEDFDLDGDVDCAVTDVGALPGRVILLENVGDGTFLTPVDLANVGAWPRGIATGDLNADGRPDLVVANMFSNTITVLLNGSTPQLGTGAIAGRVFMGGGSGSPGHSIDLKGVEVWTNPSPNAQPAISREDGSYLVGDLPPGEYTVYARLEYVEPGTGQLYSVVSRSSAVLQVASGQVVSKVDLRYPWPVVAQAGWSGLMGSGGGAARWAPLLEYFTRDPIDPGKSQKQVPAFLVFAVPNKLEDPTAGYDPSATVVGLHTENADRMATWVETKVRGELGRFVSAHDLQKVKYSFVCTGMGALITRAMIKSERFEDADIGRVVSFDGSHGGSTLASLSLVNYGLKETFLNGAEAPGPGLPGVSPVGWNVANADLGPAAAKRWLLYTCTTGGVVSPDYSACGIGRVWQVPTCTCAYGIPNPDSCLTVPQCYWKATWVDGISAQVSIPNCNSSIYSDPQRMEEGAIFLDRGVGEIEASLSLGCPGEAAGDASTLSGAAWTVATMTAGAASSDTRTLPVDTNGFVRVNALVAGEGASLGMTDPGGAPVAKANWSVTTEGDDLFLEQFDVVQPVPGDYTLTLTGGQTDATTEIRVDFENERALSVVCTPSLPVLAQPVQLTARCVDDKGLTVIPASGSVLATVYAPEPSVPPTPVTLLDDGLSGDGAAGDGVYGGLVPGTAVALDGRYSVVIESVLATAAGDTVRGGNAAFTVSPTSGIIQALATEDLVDQDGNGKAEALALGIDVTLTSDRWMSLQANLVDGSGTIISQLSQSIPRGVGPGNERVVLVVPSEHIVTHGVNGPWTLAGIQLVDQDAGALTTSWLPDYTTGSHGLSDFEGLPAPQVGYLSPTSGHAAGGTVIYLYGSGLETATDVQLGGASAQFEVLTDDLLKVTAPKFVLGTSGGFGNLPDASAGVAVDVVVTTPWGTYTAPDAFTYKYRGVATPN